MCGGLPGLTEMPHPEIIERYICSDSGAALSADERRAIEDHLAICAECREELAGEREAKTMMQAQIPIIAAPDALRSRILDALDREDRSRHRSSRSMSRRTMLWTGAAAALAACLILIVANLRPRHAANPTFDSAIASFVQSERSFKPTIGGSNDALAVALINQFGVPLVWDFSSIGLAPAGGRIDRTADGNAVAYSIYKGDRGSLLCIITRKEDFHFPAGGLTVKGIHIYRRDGFSIAATNRYAVFCIMVTRLPAADLARAFSNLPA